MARERTASWIWSSSSGFSASLNSTSTYTLLGATSLANRMTSLAAILLLYPTQLVTQDRAYCSLSFWLPGYSQGVNEYHNLIAIWTVPRWRLKSVVSSKKRLVTRGIYFKRPNKSNICNRKITGSFRVYTSSYSHSGNPGLWQVHPGTIGRQRRE